MNVLQLTSSYPRYSGDSSSIFIHNFSKFMSRWFNIYILSPGSPITKNCETIDGIKIYRFMYFLKKQQSLVYGDSILQNIKNNKLLFIQIPFFIISELFNLYKIIIREKINIVHAHWAFPQGFIAAVLKKMLNMKYKVIITIHGGDIYGIRNIFLRKIMFWAFNNSDLINPVSYAVKNEIMKGNINKSIPIRILSMGVDTSKFNRKKQSNHIRKKFNLEKYLIYVGRLSEKKGVKYLIEAMAMILELYPKMKLIVVGDGKEKDKLIKLSHDLNINENIIFTGIVPNNELINYYSEAYISVFPSQSEGLGLVIIESMLCECPVIASDVGGIKELVINEKTGLLIDQKSSKQIAATVIRFMKDKKLRKTIIKNANKHVEEKYSLESISKKYYKIYKDLLSKSN